MSSKAFLSIVAAGAIAGCARGYVSVAVSASNNTLASEVVQLLVIASDGSGADSGPILLPPDGPLDAGLLGLPDASLIFTIQAPPGSSVTVFVQGLGADGGVVAAAPPTPASSISSKSTLDLTITQACVTSRDCPNADNVCQGKIACLQGSCQTPQVAVPLDAGTPCGECSSGFCDGVSQCLLEDCGCVTTDAHGDAGYHFDPTKGEQCNGPNLSDTLPNHCRTNCRLPHCGDGVIDDAGGEICDLGSLNGTGVGCNATCDLLGLVTTIAGSGDGGLLDGVGAAAQFDLPYGIAVLNGKLYVADTYYRALREIDPTSGQVTTIAGGNTACMDMDGEGKAGTFCDINGVLAYNATILATDDSSIRQVVPGPDGGDVSTFAGQLAASGTPATGVDAGSFASALYGVPQGITQMGGIIYTNSKLDGYVLASNPASQEVSVLAEISAGSQGAIQLGGMAAVNGLIYTTIESSSGNVEWLSPSGSFGAVPGSLKSPDGLCTDGRSLYICESGAFAIRQLDLDAGTLTLLAGGGKNVEADGLGADAGFRTPAACVFDPTTHSIYVTDRFGYTVRKIQ
jgi:hypothetical protein